MGRKSTIDTLPRSVRDAIEDALEEGATIDEITGKLAELGHDRSRSAVGRFAQDFAEITRKRRAMRDAMAPFHEAAKGDAAGGVIVNLMESIVTRALMPIALADDDFDEDGGVSALELSRLANAARSVVSTKIASQREVRDAEAAARAKMKSEAAEAAETEARAAGASEATIERIKARILGLDERSA